MIRAEQIKAAVASYYRYERQCPVVAFETNSQLEGWAGELADVLVLDKNRQLIEIEVKLSISDLKRDVKKLKHQAFSDSTDWDAIDAEWQDALFVVGETMRAKYLE